MLNMRLGPGKGKGSVVPIRQQLRDQIAIQIAPRISTANIGFNPIRIFFTVSPP